MTQQEALQQFNQEFLKRVREDIFPQDCLPENFEQLKAAALFYASYAFVIQTFSISYLEYMTMVKKTSEYTLYEIYMITAMLQMRTPREIFDVEGGDFYEMIDKVEAIRVVYEGLVTPIRQAVEKRIEIMSNLKGAHKTAPVKFMNGKGRGEA